MQRALQDDAARFDHTAGQPIWHGVHPSGMVSTQLEWCLSPVGHKLANKSLLRTNWQSVRPSHWRQHHATTDQLPNDLTFRVLDKDLGNIINLVEAGSPALLGFLRPLAAAGVAPHELVVIQGAICWALGVAPSAQNMPKVKQFVT